MAKTLQEKTTDGLKYAGPSALIAAGLVVILKNPAWEVNDAVAVTGMVTVFVNIIGIVGVGLLRKWGIV